MLVVECTRHWCWVACGAGSELMTSTAGTRTIFAGHGQRTSVIWLAWGHSTRREWTTWADRLWCTLAGSFLLPRLTCPKLVSPFSLVSSIKLPLYLFTGNSLFYPHHGVGGEEGLHHHLLSYSVSGRESTRLLLLQTAVQHGGSKVWQRAGQGVELYSIVNPRCSRGWGRRWSCTA